MDSDNSLETSLAALRLTATAVLDRHAVDRHECVVCGTLWPCEQALLAERNLAVL
ncbi:hypothetical protein L1785_01105 [Antribacter sp. KLBMP9083]|uniref:Uncharacterized protein n=1 Tax=Antribacter soli TaxID=2910976 RepID=A0AA41Q9Y7_9MICO|nr:hypothetical protein [Antribacter soli]MCF4119575.1 hypothetical protein [Antribacter soli]